MTSGRKSTDMARAEAAEVLKAMPPDMRTGLTHSEVTARLREYGYNEVPEKKANLLLLFARRFWGLTAWMLEFMIILSWALHKTYDLYIIAALLVVNAILSFSEEQRASRAVDALKQKLHVSARVLRERAWQVIPSRDLVPGDVIRVRSGDFVPADAQIIQGDLGVDQSALTGESLEVDRRADDVLYSGSIVRRGEADAVVTLTGARAFFGRTVQLVQIARPRLHIEEVVSQVVRWLLAIVGVLLSVAVVASWLQGMALLEILPLMLVLLLGAIPVALPVMFTVSMAVGSMELARRGVLVTRLSASEDAATMDVLCVDKTGTITQNRLSVAQVIPLQGSDEADVLRYGALASQEANQDPIDLAFIAAAKERGLIDGSLVQTGFTPFDPQTRRTEARLVLSTRQGVQRGAQQFRVLKGAVSVIALACGLDAEASAALEARASEFASKGHRTLAVARADDPSAPQLVGLVTLYDPPRADSNQLIRQLKELGIAVKMLTGDALPIAREIAQSVGLGPNISRMADLQKLPANEAARMAEQSDGFAEVYPQDKYAVVQSLQAAGHVVGMTGDGVNDAPALRQAEVGIAVHSASDVAKGAASVVLTNEGLANIVDLVTNGRRIYQRIVTWIVNKISRTILKSAFVVIAFLVTGIYPISAFAMILVVFMTDFVKITLSTDNVRWSRQPDKWDIVGLVKVAGVLGLLMVVESLGMLCIGLKYFHLSADEEALHTFSFAILYYFAIFSLFVVRERKYFWQSMPSKPLLVALALDSLVATAVALIGIPGLRPLPVGQLSAVVLYAFFFSLVVNDVIKCALTKGVGLV